MENLNVKRIKANDFFFSFKGELAPLTSKARFSEGVNQCYKLKLKGAY